VRAGAAQVPHHSRASSTRQRGEGFRVTGFFPPQSVSPVFYTQGCLPEEVVLRWLWPVLPVVIVLVNHDYLQDSDGARRGVSCNRGFFLLRVFPLYSIRRVVCLRGWFYDDCGRCCLWSSSWSFTITRIQDSVGASKWDLLVSFPFSEGSFPLVWVVWPSPKYQACLCPRGEVVIHAPPIPKTMYADTFSFILRIAHEF
jgi:hypothetical protein